MKMNSSCVAGCLDDNAEAPPVKVSSFMKLYKWPESDAEFLIRKVNMEDEEEESTAIRFPLNSGRSPVYHYHESFASRQRYLRSYTFSRKETVGEKTKRWLKRKKKVAIKAESVQRCRRGYCRFVQVVHKLLGSLCRRRL
ncbi:hypothetical protein I3843_01G027400 [Carya illinoinensis]|uniref:Uncharacterized protein n=1 Tax=Carya illinoinensis TaxID=32201 RepID=A0A8T1RHT2_CARIL|nr:hypothetical protein I3760_01G029200 [Carya illinoinensis]KAG6666426.1 hypothetical protein CIPAW_01G030800 [Carya illinoinensis]KAG7993879.1 hypothetical protein I3843_01G027400 [Carya illinoinensis]